MIEVDAIVDSGGSCQFQPEALVSAIRYLVEAHVSQAGSGRHAGMDGHALPYQLGADQQQAPPVGFRDFQSQAMH